MTYNGRAILAEVATKHGWKVIDGLHGAVRSDGLGEFVAYERYATQILIMWTPSETARFIAKDYGNPKQVVADGPLGLITARGWLEAPA